MEIKSEPPKIKNPHFTEFAFSPSLDTLSTLQISRRYKTDRHFFPHIFSDHSILEILVSWEMATC